VLKKCLVTRFIGPFSYKNLSGQGTFSTPSISLLALTEAKVYYIFPTDVEQGVQS
jgi:hypothetical protein